MNANINFKKKKAFIFLKFFCVIEFYFIQEFKIFFCYFISYNKKSLHLLILIF